MLMLQHSCKRCCVSVFGCNPMFLILIKFFILIRIKILTLQNVDSGNNNVSHTRKSSRISNLSPGSDRILIDSISSEITTQSKARNINEGRKSEFWKAEAARRILVFAKNKNNK